jgi:hypothetical protein
MLSIALLLGASCGRAYCPCEEQKFPVVNSFQASEFLLRDAAKFLSESTGWRVELDKDVEAINDLSFDLRDISGQRLDSILNSIVAYLNGRFYLGLDWRKIDGENHIVIFNLNRAYRPK